MPSATSTGAGSITTLSKHVDTPSRNITNAGATEIVQLVKSAVSDAAKNCGSFTDAMESRLKQHRELKGQELGHFSGIPDVTWDDVGGLEHVKKEIRSSIEVKLRHPGKLAGKKSGILLWGPPGVGKTLIAKAVAHDWLFNFISIKGPELLNMYVGESEKNVREVFSKARLHAPCVLFFDELDSLAPARGCTSDSSQVMDRIVAQLLTELDGAVALKDVVIIAATNRPDLLDTALLRPGRFDKVVYVDVARSREGQLKIVAALTRKFVFDKDVDLRRVLELAEKNSAGAFTGADLYGLCSSAYMGAVQRVILSGEADKNSDKLPVRQEDFMEAMKGFKPSLTKRQISDYEQLKTKMNSC